MNGIYVYDGGRFHEVVIGDEVFHCSHLEIDQLLADHPEASEANYRNGAPHGLMGDYSRGCWRHCRPVPASIDRPCCIPAAEEIYTWWDRIREIGQEESGSGASR